MDIINNNKKGTFLNLLSKVFIFSGILILLFIFLPVIYQEVKYQMITKIYSGYKLYDENNKTVTQKLSQENKSYIIPIDYNFSLVIPKIGVNSKVIANVDENNKEEYLEALKQGVAQSRNSSLPTGNGVVFIFAHSTDNFYNILKYNAQFYLLRKLETGDEVFVYYKNQKYEYQVTNKQIVEPEEVAEIVNNLKGNFLVLQTCWPPGTTFRRLLIIAKYQ